MRMRAQPCRAYGIGIEQLHAEHPRFSAEHLQVDLGRTPVWKAGESQLVNVGSIGLDGRRI